MELSLLLEMLGWFAYLVGWFVGWLVSSTKRLKRVFSFAWNWGTLRAWDWLSLIFEIKNIMFGSWKTLQHRHINSLDLDVGGPRLLLGCGSSCPPLSSLSFARAKALVDVYFFPMPTGPFFFLQSKVHRQFACLLLIFIPKWPSPITI